MDEQITVSVHEPEGHCGVCRREIPATEQHLDVELTDGTSSYDVTICRPCLAEHAPELLAQIEEAVSG